MRSLTWTANAISEIDLHLRDRNDAMTKTKRMVSNCRGDKAPGKQPKNQGFKSQEDDLKWTVHRVIQRTERGGLL